MPYAHRRGFRRRTTRFGRPSFRRGGVKRRSSWWKRRVYRNKGKYENGFKHTKLVKLRFQENYAVTGVTVGTHTWRANGVYDPESGVGGGECSGYDTYAQQYNYYKVVGCKCQVSVDNQTTDYPLLCMLEARESVEPIPTTPADIRNRREMPNAKSRTTQIFRNGANCKREFMSMFRKTSAVLAQPVRDQAGISSVVTTTPAIQWYFDFLCCQGATAASDATNCACLFTVKLTYYVKFSGPKTTTDLED